MINLVVHPPLNSLFVVHVNAFLSLYSTPISCDFVASLCKDISWLSGLPPFFYVPGRVAVGQDSQS